MFWGDGQLSHQGINAVTNSSDLHAFVMAYRQSQQSASWWQENLDLPRYYSYRAVLELIHHYDIAMGKNYDYYFNPQTKRWIVIPWDIDLTWADNMFGTGGEPFKRPVLSKPALHLEYQNRLREIRDLLFNTNQTGALIDEYAAIIADPQGGMSIVDADRAKWDYHPIMNSQYADPRKAGQGLFYRVSPTKNFAGMVQLMKNYVQTRSEYVDGLLLKDPSIPATPKVTSLCPPGFPANSLRFRCSEFEGNGPFAAMRWRIGEVGKPRKVERGQGIPGIYEITPLWESGEILSFKADMSIPPDAIKEGHTYRVRARMKDATGRWSHWSEPVQFTVGASAR